MSALQRWTYEIRAARMSDRLLLALVERYQGVPSRVEELGILSSELAWRT